MELVEVGKELVLVGEHHWPFLVHVANGLLPIVLHSFASVVVALLGIVKNLQAILQ